MPSSKPTYAKKRVIKGTAPRKGTRVAWPPGKPPGGKLPESAKPQKRDEGSE